MITAQVALKKHTFPFGTPVPNSIRASLIVADETVQETTFPFSADPITLDTGALPAGPYTLRIQAYAGAVPVGKPDHHPVNLAEPSVEIGVPQIVSVA